MNKLEFIGVDSWDRPVYKDEAGRLWKDTNLGNGNPALCRSSNDEFDGEPDYPISGEYVLINEYKENPYRFEYGMLDRFRHDCETYFLGISNRCKDIDIAYVTAEMKKLWNKLPEDGKPEWLTWEQILDYEARGLRHEN